MKAKFLAIFILGTVLLSGCTAAFYQPEQVKGSGHVISETRSVKDFTSISIEGQAEVSVAFGPTASLSIEGEDNILPLVETVVRGKQLVIRNKAFSTFSPTKPVRVEVTMTALKAATISGSGSITASGVSGNSFKADIPGSGDITLDGRVNSVNINLRGSGNIYCDQLKAATATAIINGSGNITVYASERLDARVPGSGNIRYSGNPANVNRVINGSGTITQ